MLWEITIMKYGQAIHCTYILLWLFDHQSIYACSVQYPVCIKYTNFSIKLVNDIKTPDTPSTGNGPLQRVETDESTRHKWVTFSNSKAHKNVFQLSYTERGTSQIYPCMEFLQTLHVINTRPSNYKNGIVF